MSAWSIFPGLNRAGWLRTADWFALAVIAWMGLVLVTENIVSSLFNSHLFDFTAGWLYVFGVGVLGGMVLKERDAAAVSTP